MIYLIVLVIFLLITLGCVNNMTVKESFCSKSQQFSKCYKKQQVFLSDATGNLDTGIAYVQKQFDNTSISIDCALPIVIGGVFNYVDGKYTVFLSQTPKLSSNPESFIKLGDLVKMEQRKYKLTKTLPNNVIEPFKHILIVRYSKDINGHMYKPVLTLKGFIKI